jgi:DNA ligase 1
MMRKKPMLAYPASDTPIDYSKPIFIQPKLDGVRCLIQRGDNYMPGAIFFDPRGVAVSAYSRTGKEWKNIDHILLDLQEFFRFNPDVILDGELYNHDLKNDFEKIISLVRKTKPTEEDRLESSQMVQFHCYDIVDETKTYSERGKFIEDCVPSNYCIKHVETSICTKEDVFFANKIFLNKGYEGSILRTDNKYECKRSRNLIKLKDFQDTEATIIDWVEGKGKRIGTIGKFIGRDSEGIEFGMPVMDNFKKLQDNFEDMKTWVGKTATFTYFERTKAKSYRHPLFKALRDYE